MKNYSNSSRKPMMAGGKTTKGRSKMMAGGKATKGRSKMAAGGKMPMTTKDGKKVPAFAADGKGKMMAGGKTTKGRSKMMMGGKSTKGYSKGGRTMSSTDASTAKSTPPKTGMDASLQRLINQVRNNLPQLKKAAPSLFGSRVSDKDKASMKRAKKAPKDYGK
jgi:hypothetical protein